METKTITIEIQDGIPSGNTEHLTVSDVVQIIKVLDANIGHRLMGFAAVLSAVEYCQNRGFDEMSYPTWIKRFKDGWEWQMSDYSGRKVLKDMFPDIYPDNKDTFFQRPTN